MARAFNKKKKFRRVYWDSCVWISQIQNETAVPLKDGRVENRAQLGRPIIEDAEKGLAEIATSALALAEVNRPAELGAGEQDTADKLAEFFQNEYIVLVPLNRRVGELARQLMQAKHPGLKPLDAVHVASALLSDVDEMHCFDDALLNLTDKLDCANGKRLKICKPSMGGPPLPLLQDAAGANDAAASEDEDQEADGDGIEDDT